MTVLYHFTCKHSHAKIGESGVLVPNKLAVDKGLIPAALVWATDDPDPTRDAVGLTSTSGLITCDRMAHRYRIVDEDVSRFVPWLRSGARLMFRPLVVEALESFGQPEHWWVSPRRVRAVLCERHPA